MSLAACIRLRTLMGLAPFLSAAVCQYLGIHRLVR